MIDKALHFLTDEINAFLELRSNLNSGSAEIVLCSVSDEAGKWAIPDKKLGLSLINIEEERVFKDQQFAHKNIDGNTELYNPEIKLNLYILISANFTNDQAGGSLIYEEGLKQLSNVILFFQGKNVFTTDNSPGLDTNIKKLIVELYSYSFEQQYNFWTVIGAKYLPSVMYKVRLLVFQDKQIQSQQVPITTTDFQLSNL